MTPRTSLRQDTHSSRRNSRDAPILPMSQWVFSCATGLSTAIQAPDLYFPETLRLIHRIAPQEFPFQKNWKMSETHIAFWDLFPTVDHEYPIARGGKDRPENWITTSQLRNSAKANWTLEELGWQKHPPGNASDWDGLTTWFLEYVKLHPEHLADPYLETWYRAAIGHESRLNQTPETGIDT
jgi:hypothetical protein